MHIHSPILALNFFLKSSSLLSFLPSIRPPTKFTHPFICPFISSFYLSIHSLTTNYVDTSIENCRTMRMSKLMRCALWSPWVRHVIIALNSGESIKGIHSSDSTNAVDLTIDFSCFALKASFEDITRNFWLKEDRLHIISTMHWGLFSYTSVQ